MSYLYLKAPIFSVVSRKGGAVLASACGGSSKTGIPNLLVAFRCEGVNSDETPTSDDADDVSDDCSSTLIKDISLETGYDVEHLKLAMSQSKTLVAALCGNAFCRFYAWKELIQIPFGVVNNSTKSAQSSLREVGTFNVTRSEIEASSVAMHGETILAIGDVSGKVHIWQLVLKIIDNNEAIEPRFVGSLTGHKAKVTSLHFDKDGETLVSASDDDTLRVWELGHFTKPSTTTARERQIFCHVIHGRGKNDLGNRFVKKNTSKSTTLRWKFRGVSMKPDGCSLFALETSDSGGAVLVKWRTTSEKVSTKEGDITTLAPFESVRLDGNKQSSAENTSTDSISIAREPTKRWIFSIWTIASQTPASALATNSSFDRLVVGSNDGSVRLFDSDVLGSPLWIRKDVHQMSVTCVAFVEKGDSREEHSIVSGSADAQLVLLPMTAPPHKINPRIVVVILFLFTIALAAGSFYKFVLEGKDVASDNDEL